MQPLWDIMGGYMGLSWAVNTLRIPTYENRGWTGLAESKTLDAHVLDKVVVNKRSFADAGSAAHLTVFRVQ